LISDLRFKTSLLEQPLQKWSPAKHPPSLGASAAQAYL
jgi:hypothetical protein